MTAVRQKSSRPDHQQPASLTGHLFGAGLECIQHAAHPPIVLVLREHDALVQLRHLQVVLIQDTLHDGVLWFVVLIPPPGLFGSNIGGRERGAGTTA